MDSFTPVSSFLGGALIGISATFLLLFNGQIAGISGIVARSVSTLREKSFWRISFLVGIVIGAILFQWFQGDNKYQITIDASLPVLIIGGIMVGFGTRLGSGCTSGHGVCGIARFSKRSILATSIFMLSGMVTVYIVRHLLGG